MGIGPGRSWVPHRSTKVSRVTLVLGLLIVAGLAVTDALLARNTIVIGTVVLAPFVVSVVGGRRETAVVALAAFVVTVASGVWDHNFDSAGYYLRAVVVLAGGAVAVLAAGARDRTARDQARFELLADVAGVADGRLSLGETAARLCELVVPAVADVCIIDVVHEGEMRRLAGKASGSAVVEETLGHAAGREPDAARSRASVTAGRLVVPLSARGRTLGTLTLLLAGHPRRPYTAEDQRFAEVLSGRVALALDNAGLFTELQTSEAQLTAALGTLAEAVTVQSAEGQLIYANQAAADVLGYASPQELVATPPARVAAQYASFAEDGSPLDLGDLPGRRVLSGEEPGPLVVRVVDRRTGEQRWRQTKSTAVRDGNGDVRMIVNVIADITVTKRAELLQRLLADAGEALGSAEDVRETLQQIADICVPDLSDWCAVSMPTEDHRLQAVAVAHLDPEKVKVAQRFGERYPSNLNDPGGAPEVFREGRPQLVNDITDEMLAAAAQDDEHLAMLRDLGMRAALAVPMMTHGGTVGVLTLVSAESGRSFSDEEVALASELARLAATAVENARLYTERSRIASLLQNSLLPDELPALPGFRTASLYRPAGDQDRVGGDFYEAFRLSDDAWMFVVGDVTGRGAAAAALTGLIRHTLRAIATFTGSVTEALQELNRQLVARPRTSLCTAACVVLREVDGESQAEIICAGHPLPVLVRAGDAAYVGKFGPMLGAFADARWTPLVLPLHAGDLLVLYSDGVLDATGADDRFGPERLQATLAPAGGAADAVDRVDRALAAFQVGFQADDTAVLAIERRAVAETVTRPVESTDAAPA